MICGKRATPVSGCLPRPAPAAVEARASSTCRRVCKGAPGASGGGVQIDHRRRILMRGEGERPLPVERELGDDRVSNDDDRASGSDRLAPQSRRWSTALADPPRSRPAEPGQAGDPRVDQDPVDVDPARGRAEAVVADDQDVRRPRRRPVREQADGVVEPLRTPRAAAFQSGRSIPVSSTFRYSRPDAGTGRGSGTGPSGPTSRARPCRRAGPPRPGRGRIRRSAGRSRSVRRAICGAPFPVILRL